MENKKTWEEVINDITLNNNVSSYLDIIECLKRDYEVPQEKVVVLKK